MDAVAQEIEENPGTLLGTLKGLVAVIADDRSERKRFTRVMTAFGVFMVVMLCVGAVVMIQVNSTAESTNEIARAVRAQQLEGAKRGKTIVSQGERLLEIAQSTQNSDDILQCALEVNVPANLSKSQEERQTLLTTCVATRRTQHEAAESALP